MRSFVAACALLACSLSAATAADTIADCRDRHAADPAAHIACLEGALRARDGVAPAARDSKAGAASVPAATAASPPIDSAATLDGLGAEQARARQRSRHDVEPEAVQVRIVAVRYDVAGLGHFTLADGQQWKETVTTPERLRMKPGREYEARIERAKIGGYRLYVDGIRWMHKVERTR
jgi:hypothetical protein